MPENKPQSFADHTRWDPLFHFFLLPVFGLALLMTLIHFLRISRTATSATTSTPFC